nr:phage terminase large subunit [Eubacterium aggregans]
MDQIAFWAKCELARRDLWQYCHLMDPKFYADDRPHLKEICREIQDFPQSDVNVLVLDAPPRHGKTYTLDFTTEWFFGCDSQNTRIMKGSYNEILSKSSSKKVRDDIMAVKAHPLIPVFSDVFPYVTIKRGDGAMNLWSLEGAYNSYLATSPGGTATGFGCTLLIIDDLIKNKEEAFNELNKDKQWDWFKGTMLSRIEGGVIKIIIVMTRWASDDLVGRVLDEFGHLKIKHINYKALQDDGTMLCPGILSHDGFEQLKNAMDEDVLYANYQQDPLDLKGRLYQSFKTYDQLPVDDDGNSLLEGIYSYTDTADEGDDYLCTIIYGLYNHCAYVLDIIYTQAPMTETEPLGAEKLNVYDVSLARIESNNGGSGYARSVKRHLEDEHDNYYCDVTWFHQSKNKRARILSNSTRVENNVIYPANWANLWPDYFLAMNKYSREGANKHDDAPDCTTGVVETMVMMGVQI